MSWNPLQQPQYRWIPTVERIIRLAKPPSLSGPIINLFSDYSGSNKDSTHRVISILYMDLHSSRDWELTRRRIRGHHLSDGRRISFKDLGDRKRRRAIVPFLRAANEIDGICITFAFNKLLKNIFTTESTFDILNPLIEFEGKWRGNGFENMIRVAQLIGILVGGFSKPGQHIYWISDQDDLFANVAKSRDLQQMVSRITSFYVKHPLGELGLGTTAIDEGDRFEEDMAAIPDLAAGAISEIITKLSRSCGGVIPPSLAIPFNGAFSPKCELILSWLADRSQRLRRVTILFERGRHGELVVSRLDLPDPLESALLVPRLWH